MDFKTINGRGLPWSIKKEVALLFSFMSEEYVFPMPTDHRESIEILDYMSYFSAKGLLPKEEEEKKKIAYADLTNLGPFVQLATTALSTQINRSGALRDSHPQARVLTDVYLV